VAVKGYAGAQLLGGVVVEIVVPNYVHFDGTSFQFWGVFLPLVRRKPATLQVAFTVIDSEKAHFPRL